MGSKLVLGCYMDLRGRDSDEFIAFRFQFTSKISLMLYGGAGASSSDSSRLSSSSGMLAAMTSSVILGSRAMQCTSTTIFSKGTSHSLAHTTYWCWFAMACHGRLVLGSKVARDQFPPHPGLFCRLETDS